MGAAAAADLFAPPRVVAEERADGALLLRSAEPLGAYAPSMAHLFRAGAEAHPQRGLGGAPGARARPRPRRGRPPAVALGRGARARGRGRPGAARPRARARAAA